MLRLTRDFLQTADGINNKLYRIGRNNFIMASPR